MAKVIGVRFRNMSKLYYFDPKDFEVKREDHVIVETSKGIEYGRVIFPPTDVEDTKVNHPLKEVLRIANQEDEDRQEKNRIKEKEAYKICVQKIREHNLEMKLIDVEVAFENNKILFYFTADGRVDFRLLVKDLASVFKTRIELRQIGVRDETKILGGIGICGRGLCCHTYLSDFVPVSIRMAKEQNLSLNQTKISGVCGRLMCCLKNEQETYEDLNRRLPRIGDNVTLPDGVVGSVHSVDVLRQRVKVTILTEDEKEIVEYPVEELSFRPRKKKGKNQEKEALKDTSKEVSKEALKEALQEEDSPKGMEDAGEESVQEKAQKQDKSEKARDRRRGDFHKNQRSTKAAEGEKEVQSQARSGGEGRQRRPDRRRGGQKNREKRDGTVADPKE